MSRIPKPTALRRLEGSVGKRDVIGHRPLPVNEPQYPPGVPVRPRTLSPAARAIWDGVVEEMAPLGVLRTVDALQLAQYCEDLALLAQFRADLRAWVEREEAQNAETLRSVRALEKAGKKIPKSLQRLVVLATAPPLLSFARTVEGRRVLSSVREYSALVMVRGREFGLTPSSNSRVAATGNGAGQIDPLEKLLCG